MKHDGAADGYRYLVAEEVGLDDLYPHPHPVNIGGWEWLTRRELILSLLEPTTVREEERLMGEEIAELRRKQALHGRKVFADRLSD